MHISMWKRALIVLVCLTALFFAMPNLFYTRVQQHNDALAQVHKTGTTTAAEKAAIDAWPSWLPSSIVNLGLDLRGGAYLLAEVQLKNVYVDRMNALWPEVRDALRKDRNTIGGVRRVQGPPGTLKVKIGNPQGMQEALKAIGNLATPVVSLTSVGEKDLAITQDGADGITIQLSDAEKKATDARTVQQSLEIVRRRIDESGTREPTIQREGTNRILIEVPGISSAGELKKLIGTTAKLTFNQVIRQTSDKNANPGIGNEVLPASDQPGVYYIVNETPVVSGGELTDAEPAFDQNGRPAVNFRFGPSGARQFGDYTAAHVGQPFAIVLDQKVISAPVINEAIRGGSGIITGNFTIESSTNLAVLLRAGALPTNRHARCRCRRQTGGDGRYDRGDDLHGRGLRHVRLDRELRAAAEHGDDVRGALGHRRHADAAWHCRHRADRRHGGGRQRADLRTHPRGIACLERPRPGDRAGL
jgi:preprotein translocase subunit SecD